jgi:DNA polymerase-3 subunit alpha
VIEWLWSTNERSADYSFNRSHAACYALIGYRTAWLKANYPAEYMAALISSVMDTKDKVPFFVSQAEQMGIAILPPDVNLSDHEFVVVDGNIRFGLDAVKGVGYQAVEAIKRAREEGGPFTDIWDFCARVDGRAVNKKAIEALIKCGAFGSTGSSRRGMLMVLEQAQGAGQRAQEDAQIGQASIFDLGLDADAGGPVGVVPSRAPIPSEEFERSELLAAEKESIGLFISAHPLKEVGPALSARADCALSELAARRDGDWVTIGGMISQAKRIRTKRGDWMMFATLDDLESSVELVVFGDALSSSGDALQQDSIVLVRGRVDHKDAGSTCVIAQQIDRFQPSAAEVQEAAAAAAMKAAPPAPLRLRVDGARLVASCFEDLKEVLRRHPGEADVVIELGDRQLRLGTDFRVAVGPGLHAELVELLRDALVMDEVQPAAVSA